MMDPAQGAAEAWDRAAEGWNRHAGLIDGWLAAVTAAMLDAADVRPGAAVLDVAAGSGGQTLAAARRVGASGRVLATDISPRILALALGNAQAAGLPQVQTRVADAQALELELEGAGFDAAICRLGLMFCPEPGRALEGIAAALRPGGRLAAVVFSQPQANPCAAILMSTALRHAGRPAGTPFMPGTLFSLGRPGWMQELMRGAGFACIEVAAVAAPMYLASAAKYLEFVRESGSPVMEILAPLSAAAQQEAWEDMERQLARFDVPGGWHGPNELLLCSGRVG